MSWTAHHRRADVLNAVIAEADLRRDGTLPTHLSGDGGPFADDLDLVGALQLRWITRLSAAIERRLAPGDADRAQACRSAWIATAEEMPGVRAILDQHAEHPTSAAMERALRRASAKEHQLIAAHAGLAARVDLGPDPLAEAAGSRIVGDARSAYERKPLRAAPTGSAAFVARLKAALAA